MERSDTPSSGCFECATRRHLRLFVKALIDKRSTRFPQSTAFLGSSHPRCLELNRQGRSAICQRLCIYLIVIRPAIFPTPEHDPNPFVCQCSDSGVMITAAYALPLILQFGPRAELPSLIGKLMKRLKHKLRARPTPMDPFRFATSFRHRRYSRELLHLHRGLKAIPIRAEGRHKPRG